MAKKKGDIYGEVNNANDISKINRDIRRQIRATKSHDMLTKLVRRSRYLITLTSTPAWKDHLKGKLAAVKKRARKEYCSTATVANIRAKSVKGAEPIYSQSVC